tara:strand:+ start:442 stop:1527 length:1086 start_codon:yes stop_codon:yes gene_type:complete
MSQSDLTHAFHIAYTEDRVRKLKSDIVAQMEEIELLKGDKGDSIKGDKGDSVKGDKGNKGDKGDKGDSVKGDKGDKGDSVKGDKGDKGDSVKGDKGDSVKGDKGDKGDSVKGDKGDSVKGDKGDSVKGDKGDKGDSIKGDKGDSIKGDKGDKGDSVKGDSVKGDKGDRGDKGDSVKGDKGDSIKGDKGDKGDTPDIEAKFEEALAQFNDKLNSNQKLVKTNTDTMLSNVQKQLSTLGGGGSYKILDNADVEKTKLSSVVGDSILVYDPAKRLFVVQPFLTILDRLKAELEVQYDKLIDEDAGNSYTYVGESVPGTTKHDAIWRIKRIYELTGGDLEILWANGTSNFDKTWNLRATYTFTAD